MRSRFFWLALMALLPGALARAELVDRIGGPLACGGRAGGRAPGANRSRGVPGAAFPSSDVRDRGADRGLLSRRALAVTSGAAASGALRSLGVDPPHSRRAGVQRPGRGGDRG